MLEAADEAADTFEIFVLNFSEFYPSNSGTNVSGG
jgi:hypothetical protein